MSQNDTEEGRISFPAVLHRMLGEVTKTSPELMGWSKCGSMFYFDPLSHEDAMKKAITPFFSHGNFASMRRQLSAYKFMRESGTTGYWYHPRFHRKSTYEDLLVIQKGRRRRSKFKEKVHKSKSLNVFKPKPAPVPRNFLNGPGPLANVDINANHAHKPHKQGSTFPEILSEMLNKLSLWSEDGKAFFINRSMFEEHSKTVSVFFSHGSFESFRRQLSSYGFQRLSSGTLEGYWHHPDFSSKRRALTSNPRLGLPDADANSIVSCEEQSGLAASVCPLTTVYSMADTGAITKRNILSMYFCKACQYMEGKVCCVSCDRCYHENCTTSRCVRGSQHSDLVRHTTMY